MRERLEGPARFIRKYARTAAAAVAAISLDTDHPGMEKPRQEPTEEIALPREHNPFFDDKPEYFVHHERGEYTKTERAARTKRLANGEEIFVDNDLIFYKVRKGDSISVIRERLGKYPQFAHLKNQTGKLESFNIPAKKLRADMWLPIPLENKDRHLTDAQFASYAVDAVTKMRKHERYGKEVEAIIGKTSVREIVATMLAIAKQESGGQPIGNFELHRWEPGYSAFSFSLFHVLMNGAGLKARRNLGMTEGQLYHPENAAQLFLAFMCEKGDATRYFPLDQHQERFAVFYNGSGWKVKNPHYVDNINAYYASALATLDSELKGVVAQE